MPSRAVLLVEPWMSGSHEAWALGLQRHSRHDVTILAGSPAGWRKTIDEGAAELASRVPVRPDVVVASSMLDLPFFLQRSGLAGVPSLVYFHENQLTYDRERPDRARGGVNWRSVVTADAVAFNSEFHLGDFFEAVPQIEADAELVSRARRRAVVVPVGIEPAPATPAGGGPPTILWNHRWEYDKDPGTFVDAVVAAADLRFQVILAGEGRAATSYQATLRDRLGTRVIHAGFADRSTYLELLGRADLAVSTARQEFFGVSIAEAMAAGAVPLVPDRLAYPELLGPELATCLYAPGSFAARLRSALIRPEEWRGLHTAAQAAGSRFAWEVIAPDYDELIDSMV